MLATKTMENPALVAYHQPMNIRDWLRQWQTVREEDAPMDEGEFAGRVRIEYDRIGAHASGVLYCEAMTITEHLTLAKVPAARDMVDLRAITLLLLDRYDYRPLHPLRHHATLEATQQAFREYFFAPLLEETSWSEHLAGATAALHRHEMETLPVRWLMEWRPSEPRLHDAKSRLLQDARLSTLTTLLLLLAQREVALLEEGAPVFPEADYTGEQLWHSVTDTRAMRLQVSDIWAANPHIPPDYRRAVYDRPPMEQLALLNNKRDVLSGICRSLEEQESAALQAAGQRDKTEDGSAFRLYRDSPDA